MSTDPPISTFGKHVMATIILLFVVTIIVCVGSLVYWAVTNLADAGLALLAIAGIGFVVHIMVRLINWEDKDD